MNRKQRRKALANNPLLAGKHNDRGIKFLNQGQLSKAVDHFEKALSLKPRHAGVHNNLGLALKDLGRPEEAEQRFRKALALKPDLVEAYNNLGLVFKIQGKFDAAIAWCREAIERRPDLGDAYGNLAAGYEQLNRMEETKSIVEQGLAVAPAHPFLNLIAARCERRADQIIVDKQPFNLVAAGLIWRMFPKARFIMMVRHPCDACLSCFMQNFAMNNAMANFFTLEDTATLYVKAMALWQQYLRVLPLNCHVVKYESLVDDFDSQVRSLLDFLGVGWDDTVREYASRAVERGEIDTPSYHQVAEPIYSRAKYRWRRYAAQLEPVMETLAPYIDHFGYGNDE